MNFSELLKSLKLNIFLTLFIPSICLSEDVGIPTINSAPVFWGMLNNNEKYRDAAFKAQEAFFLQSGIAQQYELVTRYISYNAVNTAKKLEHEALNSEYVFLIAGISYSALIRKEVTQTFRNPFLRNVSHVVTLSKDYEFLGAQISF